MDYSADVNSPETTIESNTAVDELVAEGFPREDVLAVADSLIASGLAAEQPETETWFTVSEMDVMRRQLRG